MTLKEQLVEKKAALKALEDEIKAENEEAIAQGEEIAKEIEDLEGKVETAEKASELLEQIGTEGEPEEQEMNENGIKSMDLASIKGKRGAVSTYIKAATDVETAPTVDSVDNKVVDVQNNLGVRALFGAESISGNALTYFVMGTTEGAIASSTAEGAAKSQIHVPYTPSTKALNKIAAYLKETDELLSDATFLESAIRNRGVFEFNKAVENYLVSTLMSTSGVQTGGTTINFDEILKAKQDIYADTGYAPDAMIINPADWATLLLTKDGGNVGQYMVGGPAYAPYGNGAYSGNPRIWGMQVVESAAVPAGKVVVGAFKAAASVVTKAGEGLRVEVSNSDQDDFIKNMVTVRIEERLVEAVRVPAAFEIIGQ